MWLCYQNRLKGIMRKGQFSTKIHLIKHCQVEKYIKSFSNPGTWECAIPVKSEPQARTLQRRRQVTLPKETSKLTKPRTEWKELAGIAAAEQRH